VPVLTDWIVMELQIPHKRLEPFVLKRNLSEHRIQFVQRCQPGRKQMRNVRRKPSRTLVSGLTMANLIHRPMFLSHQFTMYVDGILFEEVPAVMG
jgi:hypothetical protein